MCVYQAGVGGWVQGAGARSHRRDKGWEKGTQGVVGGGELPEGKWASLGVVHLTAHVSGNFCILGLVSFKYLFS